MTTNNTRLVIDPQVYMYRLCVVTLLLLNGIALSIAAAGVWRLVPN